MDPKPDSKIQFKPVNPGLGFHPFSEGMPYAPPPQMPPPPTRRPGAPSGAGIPKVIPVRPRVQKPASLAQSTPTPQLKTLQKELAVAPFGPNYLSRRFASFLVDLTLHSVLLAGLFVGFVSAVGIDWNQLFSPEILAFELGFIGFFHFSLLLIQDLIFGTSLGKRLFGLRLVGDPTRVLFRGMIFPLSIGLAGIGLMSLLFDSKKRCLHDLASGVQPVRE